jgi:phosphoglycerol transferase MdoB-like AlkP superfamily enzyme
VDPVRARLPAGLAAIVSIAVLNVALTFGNLWPTLWIEPALALSMELAFMLLVLALVAERRGAVPARLFAWLAAIFVVLAIGRYAEVTAKELYGRPINLYYDLPHLPRVVAMFLEAASPTLVAGTLAAALAGVAALYALMKWSWRTLARALAVPAPRRAIALVAAGACVAYPFAPGWFGHPVSASYANQAVVFARSMSGGGATLGASPDFGGGLGRLGAADVYVIFIESYGAATYERAEYAQRLAPERERLARAIAATGRGVVSAFVESPTFGGASWLAHASLLSGVDVREGDAYNLLLTGQRDTLVRAFARRGYRTIALMPGLRQDWREGETFYGFDEIYGAARLDYRGPAFGWWRIPDQYALAKLHRLEAAAAPGKPRFVFFPTISSHAPFRPTPPYDPDWARVAERGPAVADTVKVAATTGWDDLEAAYGTAVGYSLAWLSGYLVERANDDMVLVVLGDHQPPAGVAGEKPSWDVPVHVIASRPEVLASLAASGFEPGLAPHAPAVSPMHQLTATLLRAFAQPAQATVHVAGSRPGG